MGMIHQKVKGNDLVRALCLSFQSSFSQRIFEMCMIRINKTDMEGIGVSSERMEKPKAKQNV